MAHAVRSVARVTHGDSGGSIGALTVMAAEDLVDTVKSVTARDRSGEMIPITRVS